MKTEGTQRSEAPPWHARMRIGFYAFLFGSVVATGLVNLLDHSWSPAFRLNLALHPVLGTIVTLVLLASLFRRLRSQVPGLTYTLLSAALVILFAGMVRSFTLVYLPIFVSNLIAGGLIPVLLLVGLFFFVRAVPLMPTISRVRHGWLNLALIVVWLTAAVLGAVILAMAGRGSVPGWVFDFHTAAGLAGGALGIAALGMPAFRGRGSIGLGAGLAAALLAVLGLGALWNGLRPAPLQIEATEVHLSSIPLERRAPEERDAVPFAMDARWLEINGSCGGSACHADIVDDAARSVHDLTYRTPHMHRVLDLLAAEEGEHNRMICAGCHVPGALFAGGTEPSPSVDAVHLSCVFCHSITEAHVDGPTRSRYTVEPPVAHLADFAAAEARGEPLPDWERFLVQLNPGAHGRAFYRPVIEEDRLCQACHHGQLREVDESRRCIDCHMSAHELDRTRTDYGVAGMRSGAPRTSANHRFIGANSTLHHLLGEEDDADHIEAFLSGELFIEALDDLYDSPQVGPRLEGAERRDRYFYAEMRADFVAPPRPGEAVELVLTTRNLGLGHAFPSSSLDLEEAWLELQVTDERGEIVFSVGGVDEDGRILDDAPRLGGYLVGLDGERVRHYRVWQVDHEVVERRLPVDGEITDRFRWTLPETSRRFLTVEARWRYRKLGHDFWTWAYPEGGEIPSPVVVRHFSQHEVAAPVAPGEAPLS